MADIPRSIDEFIRESAKITDVPGLMYYFQQFVADYGFGISSYHIISENLYKKDVDESLVFHNFPEEWVEHYIEQEYYENDPIITLATRSARPFHWFEVEELLPLTDEQKQFLEDLKAQGFTDGLAVPVFTANGSIAYFGLGCAEGESDLTSEQEREILFVCHQTHLRYMDITSAEAEDKPDLSAREKDVLYWIAQGKSNSVIADILEISDHTVDTLVRRCFSKLGVSNRVSAALKGVGSGLILP
jgi:DNA-binding CsgD family transcriptional regulator